MVKTLSPFYLTFYNRNYYNQLSVGLRIGGFSLLHRCAVWDFEHQQKTRFYLDYRNHSPTFALWIRCYTLSFDTHRMVLSLNWMFKEDLKKEKKSWGSSSGMKERSVDNSQKPRDYMLLSCPSSHVGGGC